MLSRKAPHEVLCLIFFSLFLLTFGRPTDSGVSTPNAITINAITMEINEGIKKML